VALGLLIGMTGALGVGQVLRGLATQVSHTDPLTLLAVPALLIGVAITATTIPARRAIRLEPVAALRAD
jgi:ABC-type lipoprotein release transport system permease subunit